MPNRLPTLTIDSPLPNAPVGTAPFEVTGLVMAPGMPEPVAIDSVIVEIDGQAAVDATLTRFPLHGDQPLQVTFKATMQITGGQDPHYVTVAVVSDSPIRVTQTVTVTVGPRLVAPDAWADVFIPEVDPSNVQTVADSVQNLLGTLARRLAPLSLVTDFLNENKMLVGPNMLALPTQQVLRIGFWILDIDFPYQELIQPTSDFPMYQLTPDVAAGCLAPPLLPLSPVPRTSCVSPATTGPLFAFALSIPTPTLQLILDALQPAIEKAAHRHGVTVNSIAVQTGDNNTVIGQVQASYASVGFELTVAETLGMQQREGTQSNMAAALSTHTSSSVDFPLGPFISGFENDISAKVQSDVNGVLHELPAWIPFRSSSLPQSLQAGYPFPMAVLNFDSFGTSDSGITGTGSGCLANRDQSMVAVSLNGPGSVPDYSLGTEVNYDVVLMAFEPNNDQMTWQLNNVANTVDIDQFSQEGQFSTTFPTYTSGNGGPFSLSVSGTETCATDPAQVLNGSAALLVDVGPRP
ncbi:MAG TPA: hypothetical protein VKT72_00035 [Candidatus Baltobacteraceae bacterium]|nr:hypothetical protein [Candidatus Baltobacteraceae bacterium]